jgi:hypothetical protein
MFNRRMAIQANVEIRGLSGLLLEDHWRPADSLGLKSDGYLNAVRDPDKWNAAVDPIVFTVKGHCPFYLAYAFALAVGRQR